MPLWMKGVLFFLGGAFTMGVVVLAILLLTFREYWGWDPRGRHH